VSIVRGREEFEREEAERLASYAVHSAQAGPRLVSQTEHAYRTAFQRDRDRIVHSRAFRRLEYKTQVFVHHEGDHYRNRLTHTLEAAQIARTIARALRLNEDLAETVALAHDLGHTPFGHAGERVLAKLMQSDGGFDHNRQSLRIVDWVERRYPDFRGLNLTADSRCGILKHGAGWDHPVALPELETQASLEGQAADIGDEIAYMNHDLDDGLRAGLLTLEQLDEQALWREARGRVEARMPKAEEPIRRAQTIVALIDALVTDAIENTARRLAEVAPQTALEVRRSAKRLVGFSEERDRDKRSLKRFLRENFYEHPSVLRMTRKAEWVVGDLFRTFREDPALLPADVRVRFPEEGEARAIADHIACMTDRYAMSEHRKLLDPNEPL
jgi:dGTPase